MKITLEELSDVLDTKTIPKELKDSYTAIMTGKITKKQNDLNILNWYKKYDKHFMLRYKEPMDKPEFYDSIKKQIYNSNEPDYNKYKNLAINWDTLENKRLAYNDSNLQELKALIKTCNENNEWEYKKKLKELLKEYENAKMPICESKKEMVSDEVPF